MSGSTARGLVAVAATALLALPAPVLAQGTRDIGVGARGSTTLTGQVVADDSSGPISRALVTVKGIAPAFAEVASTDADGRFAFTGLPVGDVTITASKTT